MGRPEPTTQSTTHPPTTNNDKIPLTSVDTSEGERHEEGLPDFSNASPSLPQNIQLDQEELEEEANIRMKHLNLGEETTYWLLIMLEIIQKNNNTINHTINKIFEEDKKTRTTKEKPEEIKSAIRHFVYNKIRTLKEWDYILTTQLPAGARMKKKGWQVRIIKIKRPDYIKSLYSLIMKKYEEKNW